MPQCGNTTPVSECYPHLTLELKRSFAGRKPIREPAITSDKTVLVRQATQEGRDFQILGRVGFEFL